MKKLRINTLSRKTGGDDYAPDEDDFDSAYAASGGGTIIRAAYTCGGYQFGTCPPGYFCVGYKYQDPSCGLLQILTGTCPTVVTYECI